VTHTDPRHLAGLTEAQRDQAMARWQVLRPHIEDGVPTAGLAVQCGVADRTLQRWVARYHQVLACLSHSAGERYLAVQARDGEQPPDRVPGAYHMQAGPVRGGPAGGPGQHPQPGRVDEGDPVQVDDQRPSAGGRRGEPLLQLRHGGDINLPGYRGEHVAWFPADLDRQPVVVHGLLIVSVSRIHCHCGRLLDVMT
jgi:hypothetical protein